MSKPFFYRIEAADFFTVVSSFKSDKDLGKFIRQFSIDLITKTGSSDYANRVISEAIEYIEKKKIAGKKGGEQKSSSARAVLEQCYDFANSKSVARSSTEAVQKETSSRSKKRAPSGDHQKFLHYWGAVWLHEFDVDYIFTGKDQKHVKTLLQALGLRASMGKAAAFIMSGDKFLDGKKDIPMMVSMINRIEFPNKSQRDELDEAGLLPPRDIDASEWDFWKKGKLDEA